MALRQACCSRKIFLQHVRIFKQYFLTAMKREYPSPLEGKLVFNEASRGC